MASPYFNNYKDKQEISVIEDLWNEAIYQMGFSGYYIPNSNTEARDLIFGDDPLKKFTSAYALDMYLVNSMDYSDEQDFFTKFGLEVRNNVKIQITSREFDKCVAIFPIPREGDLIFIPFMKNDGELFEITFVNTSKDLYTLGRAKPYYYEITLEPFKYNQETIDTGIPDIDIIEDIYAYNTVLDLHIGSGNYFKGELVYQGMSLDTAIASAKVSEWDGVHKNLTVIDMKGDFSSTSNLYVIGTQSGSSYSFISSTDASQHFGFDNEIIQNEAEKYVDSSQINPFGIL